jgi:hypothetical protein
MTVNNNHNNSWVVNACPNILSSGGLVVISEK